MPYVKHCLWILSVVIVTLSLSVLGTSCSSGEKAGLAPKPVSEEPAATPSPTSTPSPEPPKYTSASEIRPLSIDQIFKKEPLPSCKLDPAKTRTMIATGDIIPAKVTNWLMVQRNNFKYPFELTVDYVRDADISLINLEAPLIKGCEPTRQGMVLCGDQRFIEGLTFAGVDVANLANNHSRDYGTTGISQTVELLAQSRIDAVGIGNSLIEDVKGLRFGFLGYNGVGPRFDRERIRQDISALRSRVDVVVVAVHWGAEYVAIPEIAPGLANDNPREIGRLVVDAGADLIIGNHPHWVQGLEIYKGKLITYAHGNYIFDQMWSQETREGVIGRYTFYENRLIDVEFKPTLIENYAQPHFLTVEEGKPILDRMETASREMAKGVE